jgi:hypothetical protein
VQIREFQHSGKILFSVYTSVVDPDNLIYGSGSRNVKKLLERAIFLSGARDFSWRLDV